MRLLNYLGGLVASVWTDMCKYPAPIFKGFTSLVLVQFSLLSFLAVALPDTFTSVEVGRSVIGNPHYWWGMASFVGACTLMFEHQLRGWVPGTVCGYAAAISSFLYLGYDYMLRKPPVFAGSLLAATAAIYLGGLLYGRVRR